jgi:hypothetical protein
MNKFTANEVFTIKEVSKDFPLNLKFEVKEMQTSFDFSKPIVYSIYFDDKPIYFGFSFNNQQKDLRLSRWSKQLETILFRGYRVGLNKKSCKVFQNTLQPKIEYEFQSFILNRVKKTDVMTSANRINFAAKNWDEIKVLSSLNDSLLQRILFQIEDTTRLSTKKDFENRVKELIDKYKTCCNG